MNIDLLYYILYDGFRRSEARGGSMNGRIARAENCSSLSSLCGQPRE